MLNAVRYRMVLAGKVGLIWRDKPTNLFLNILDGSMLPAGYDILTFNYSQEVKFSKDRLLDKCRKNNRDVRPKQILNEII